MSDNTAEFIPVRAAAKQLGFASATRFVAVLNADPSAPAIYSISDRKRVIRAEAFARWLETKRLPKRAA
jgi:hypothetical protein